MNAPDQNLELYVTVNGIDAADALGRIRRIPVRLLIAVRQEYMIAKGYSREPTVGDLFDWSLQLSNAKLSAQMEETNV
jgi:hypothetical protein